MQIAGLQKLTLIDFPDKIACTVFTSGCNFCCPFCHNPELVLPKNIIPREEEQKREKGVFDFLKSRKGKLDGVCITGGEPTIQLDLIEFIKKIKSLNFAVKLDTNGTNPEILEKLFQEKLLDFVAMDIKNSQKNYHKACGLTIDLAKIKASVQLIQTSGINYEFRTTVVPTIHNEADFEEIGQWLKGSKRYSLQAFQDNGKLLDKNLLKNKKYAILDLVKLKTNLDSLFDEIQIRD